MTVTTKEQQFKAIASTLSAPDLETLFDGLKAEGDAVPLHLLAWVGAEHQRALKDPRRRGW